MGYHSQSFRNVRRSSVCGRRGSILASYGFIIVALTGIASLAVDLGHVQLVKTQLQVAADAASRAGALQLAQGSTPVQIAAAVSSAISTAALNTSDNQPVVLITSDVTVGNYDTTQSPTFSVSRSPTNAVQVSVHRQASRGTAVMLSFAPLIGQQSCDVEATSLAAVDPPMSPYGIAGINHANFASLGVLAKVTGNVVSDGDIGIGNPLGLLVSVTGNAQSYSGFVSHGGMAQIGGTTTNLTKALNYPAVVVPSSNNNASISSYLDSQNNFIGVGLVTIPSGSYVVHNLNLLADVSMDLQGPVTFYVTGAFNLAASVTILGQTNTTASNFIVEVANGGTVTFIATIVTPIAMELYAPQSAISINVGVNSFTGELIGLTLDINLPVLGTFTEVKPASQPLTISWVKSTS